MIYLDSCALLKFIKREKETDSLRDWRTQLPQQTELVTSGLARLEITRTLFRARVDEQRIPYIVSQALRGLYLIDVNSAVLARAMNYRFRALGSLDAIHLASAEPFQKELTEFITYDTELATAASQLGFDVNAPL